MRTTQIDPDGTVLCPCCGSTSLAPARTRKSRLTLGFYSARTTPTLRCNLCGRYLKMGPAEPSGRSRAVGEHAAIADATTVRGEGNRAVGPRD
jgi:hypothetical protein